MVSYKYIVSGKQGLHTTNAMSLCRVASDYESNMTLKRERKSTDCKNTFALVSPGAHQRGHLELLAEEPDENQVIDFLQGLMRAVL